MNNTTTGQNTPQNTESVFWGRMQQITMEGLTKNQEQARQTQCEHIVAYGEICIKCGKDMWG